MIDKISHDRIQLLHPKLRVEAAKIIDEVNTIALTGKAKARITSTLRTFAEQTALYNQGRTKPGQIVTNAKAGQSNHNFGLSLDFALIVDSNADGLYDQTSWDVKKDYDGDLLSDWMEVVRVFKRYGWEWGGDWKSFKDMPHVQKTFGLTTKDCLARYNAKRFIPGTSYIVI